MKIDRPSAPDQNTTQLGVAPLPRNGTGILSLPEDRRSNNFIFLGSTLPRKMRTSAHVPVVERTNVYFFFHHLRSIFFLRQ